MSPASKPKSPRMKSGGSGASTITRAKDLGGGSNVRCHGENSLTRLPPLVRLCYKSAQQGA